MIRNAMVMMLLACLSCGRPGVKPASSGYALPADKSVKVSYRVFNCCKTYYFQAKDSTNRQLMQVIGYDENNREKDIVWRGGFESYVDATIVKFYDDAGLLKEEYYRTDADYGNGDFTKTLNDYDSSGRLHQSVSFSFKRRMRKDTDKGLGRPGGCIVSDADYEKNRSWAVETVWNYTYGTNGKLREKYAPVFNSSQNHYLYVYDSAGRLIENQSLEDKRLIWTEKYSYAHNGYEYSRTWFEYDGSLKKDVNGAVEPIDIFRIKKDSRGNETEELSTDENNRQSSRHKRYYDDKNRVTRHEIFNEKDVLLGVYVYEYETVTKPLYKEFRVNDR